VHTPEYREGPAAAQQPRGDADGPGSVLDAGGEIVQVRIISIRTAAITVAALIAAAAGFAEGSGERWTVGGRTEVSLSGFTGVSTSAGIAVEIRQARDYRVTLFADRDLAERIRIEMVGDELRIGLDRWFPSPFFWGRRGARVEVDMPDLRRVGASGGAPVSVQMDARDAEVLVSLSGGASIRGSLGCGSLSLDGSGGSTARLSGSAGRLYLTGSGGAVSDLDGFTVRSADVRLSGGASGRVDARELLSVRASGGAHLVYRGSPRMDSRELTGGAWVRSE
jgi:hypothetical protein